MTKFRGATNLAEKQAPTQYKRLSDTFHFIIPTTASTNVAGAVVLPFSKSDTGASIVTYPLNERLELGIRDIKILPNNWDTFGSPAPSSETIFLAIRVAQLFPTELQPEIMPENDGSIGFYWETSKFSIILYVDSTKENGPKFEVEDLMSGLPVAPFRQEATIWEIADGVRKFLINEIK